MASLVSPTALEPLSPTHDVDTIAIHDETWFHHTRPGADFWLVPQPPPDGRPAAAPGRPAATAARPADVARGAALPPPGALGIARRDGLGSEGPVSVQRSRRTSQRGNRALRAAVSWTRRKPACSKSPIRP